MPAFIVYVKEVWLQAVNIKAQTKKEPIDLVADGQGDYIEGQGGLEYSHSLETDEWDAEQKQIINNKKGE